MPKLKHPGLRALTTLGYPLVRMMPVKLASRVLAALAGRLSGVFAKTHVMDRNLRAAFPEMTDAERLAIRQAIIANFGRLMAEIVHMPTIAAGRQGTSVEAVGATDYTFKARGQAIYVCAHLCNWEVIPLVFERAGLPLTIIYSLIGNRFVDNALAAARSCTGSTYVEKSQALRACFQTMKRGESIAFLVDQRVEVGIEVEFFGRPTTFTHMPARLALKFGCPIIPGETRRIGPGRIELVFHEPIWPSTEAGPRSEAELTQLMARAIEGTIRRQPETWICNKSRWKHGADLEAKSAAAITAAAV